MMMPLLPLLLAAVLAGVQAAPQVDLAVQFEVAGLPDIVVGEALGSRFSVLVTNNGPEALPASDTWYPVGFYISLDDTIKTSDVLLVGGREGWKATKGLAVGASIRLSIYSGMFVDKESLCGIDKLYLGVLLEGVPEYESDHTGAANFAAHRVRLHCPGEAPKTSQPLTTPSDTPLPWEIGVAVRLRGEQEISIDEPLADRLQILLTNKGRPFEGAFSAAVSVSIGELAEPRSEKDVPLMTTASLMRLPSGLRTAEAAKFDLPKDLRVVSRFFCGWRYIIVRVWLEGQFERVLVPVYRFVRVWIRCRRCDADDCGSCLEKNGCGWCNGQQSSAEGTCLDLSRPFNCPIFGLYTDTCPGDTAPCCPANPDKANWNDADTLSWNNCYNYASNIETDTFAQPGRASGNPLVGCCTCPATIAAANSDGVLGPVADQHSCPAGYCSVFLVVSDDSSGTVNDYHWYRLNQDGTWSHKPGGTAARCTDAAGVIIADPRLANHHYAFINYNRNCGFMCVPCSDPNFQINLLDQGLGASVGLLSSETHWRERNSEAVRGFLEGSGDVATFGPGFMSSLEPKDYNTVPGDVSSKIVELIAKLSRPIDLPHEAWLEKEPWIFNYPCSREACGSYLIGSDGRFLNLRTSLMYEFVVDAAAPWKWLDRLGFQPPRSHRKCGDLSDCTSCQEHNQCHWTGGKCTACITECIQATCPARCEDLTSCDSCNTHKRCAWSTKGDGCLACAGSECDKPKCPRQSIYAAQFKVELLYPENLLLAASAPASESPNKCPDLDQPLLFKDLRKALGASPDLSIVECGKTAEAGGVRVDLVLELDDEDDVAAKAAVTELTAQVRTAGSALLLTETGKFFRDVRFVRLRPILFRKCALGVTWLGNTYRVNLGTGATEFIAASGFAGLNSLTVGGSVFYSMSGATLVSINPSSGLATSLGTVTTAAGLTARALAYRSTNARLYAIMSPSSTTAVDQLWTINPTTLAAVKIGDLVGFSGIQASMFRSSVLYGWSIFHGLVTININTAAVALVGLGTPGIVGSAQWMTQTIFQNFVGRSSIYRVSTSTSVGTFVASTDNSGDFRGMEISNLVSCPTPSCAGTTCGACAAESGCGWCNGGGAGGAGTCFPTSQPFSCTVGSLFTTAASCPPPVAIRRNVDDLSASELRRLRRAWKQVAASGDFEAIALVHGNSFTFRFCHHNKESFPEWHRPYVRAFEELLQAADAAIQAGPDAQAGSIDYSSPLGLPFWAWSDVAGVPMSPAGIQNAWCRPSGASCLLLPTALSAPTAFVDSATILEPNPLYRFQTSGGSWTSRFGVFPTIAGFDSSLLDAGAEATHALTWDLQETPHDSIHCDVGPTMCSTNSALDPAFWFHHNNVDRILQGWYELGSNQANSITEMAASPGSITIPIPGFPSQTYTRLATKLPPYLDGGGKTDPWNAAADYYTVQDVLSMSTEDFGYTFASVPQWPPPLLEENSDNALLNGNADEDYLDLRNLPAKSSATILVFIDLDAAALDRVLRDGLQAAYQTNNGSIIGKAQLFTGNGPHDKRDKHVGLRGYLRAKDVTFDAIRTRIHVVVWPHDPHGLVGKEEIEPPLPLHARLIEDYYKEHDAVYPGHRAVGLDELRKRRQGIARVAGLHIKDPVGAVTIGTDGAMRFGSSAESTIQYQNDIEVRGVNLLEQIRKVEGMVERLQKELASRK